jgi:hypothetical protein
MVDGDLIGDLVDIFLRIGKQKIDVACRTIIKVHGEAITQHFGTVKAVTCF